MKRIGIALPLGAHGSAGAHALDLTLQLVLKGLRPTLLDMAGHVAVDPLRRRLLAPALDQYARTRTLVARNPGRQLPFPVLHALGERLSAGRTMGDSPGRPDIGLAFFTHVDIPPEHLQRAAALPLIVAASSWHTRVLRDRGLDNVVNCPPGVDPALFHPAPRGGLFPERFAIFCSGPLSYRKGHDLLLAAFRVFHQRHPEALLVCAWGQSPPEAPDELAASLHIDGCPGVVDGMLQLAPWLARNGVAPAAVVDLGRVPHGQMPGILRECDLAVFPGRATHGIPRAVMEALACGLPAVLSANTGHLDLLGEHVYVLKAQGDIGRLRGDPGKAGWGESSVEELLAAMESAYRRRAEASAKGRAAARFMESLQSSRQVDRLLAAIRRADAGIPVPAPKLSEDYRWGLCLHRGGQYAEAQAVYDEILERAPDHVGARMDRGHVRRELGDAAGSEADFRTLLAARPDHPQALHGLGNLLKRRGAIEESITCLRRALRAADTPSIHWDLAWCLLLLGRYRDAWPHFEHRHAALGLRTPAADKPRWDGQPVVAGTLLVLDEQGLGDTLQFLRFLPRIPTGPGGRVIFAGKPATLSVVRRILPEADVFDWDQALPRTQAWVPLMSLPHCLGVTRPEEICPPSPCPGALVEPARVAQWRRQVRGNDDRPVVGLCWRGNPDFSGDAVRSPGLAVLQPILAVAGLRFVSLQVGPGRREIADLGLGDILHDVGGAIEADGANVLDTLAVLESCDLVLTSCTSMAHMAGLAGRPGRVLLSTRSDWRWMTGRSDSPWYPSLRLIRQRSPGDWAGVAQAVAADLADWCKATLRGN
ncbi:glycosyltransferase [Denitromonas iodatirespirans]|uniref:Tetratricopeptide repeat protein n=1 Tax=Denitromonas iodatirespirans TaxID=2795389 RepID=A0A944H9P6_DENI1|nr:glycosyltransferase [Denitromonas iodatirespirans]MBT0963459.1 tetratricopeptide repeat protein [Denitromonas iodatirespirans]